MSNESDNKRAKGADQPAVGEWKFQIAAKPRLTMYEEIGKHGVIVWAKWFDPKAGKNGAPKTKTTGISVRFPEGHRRARQVCAQHEQEVIRLAQLWHADLVAAREPGKTNVAQQTSLNEADKKDLTIPAGFKLYLDLEKGRYPNPHDDERGNVERASEDAITALGASASWSGVIPIDAAQSIWRHVRRRFAAAAQEESAPAANKRRNRTRKDRAVTPTEGRVWAVRCVQHFFAAAEWLASRGHIPANACARPAKWRTDFKNDWVKLTGQDVEQEKEGKRFTPAEAGLLLEHINDAEVDPRLRLNISFGGDSLRAGQVRRAMRTHLDLSPVGEFGLGRLKVLGRGKKMGSVVDLDKTTRDILNHEMSAGYLRDLEAAYQAGRIADYALMPQGRFVRGVTPVRADRKYLRPISKRGLLDFFHELESTAGVEHVPQRGWYGLRRLWSDLSPEHVKTARAREVMGGWARGSKVPDQVYRTKEDEAAIREAARGRSVIREALREGTISELTALRSEAIRVLNDANNVQLLQAVLRLVRNGDFCSTADQDE